VYAFLILCGSELLDDVLYLHCDEVFELLLKNCCWAELGLSSATLRGALGSGRGFLCVPEVEFLGALFDEGHVIAARCHGDFEWGGALS